VNLQDASTEFLPVVNFPARSGSYFDATSAVYVDQLNRIYIFGGVILSYKALRRTASFASSSPELSKAMHQNRNRDHNNLSSPVVATLLAQFSFIRSWERSSDSPTLVFSS
jgi:hypothetical protein